jgi:hypothetical protein
MSDPPSEGRQQATPRTVEPYWAHTRIDGSYHRSYRVAGWPQLPVGSDWMNELLTSTRAVRTVTVVWEPVPMGRAARAADREVMSSEADAAMKTQKGFRVNAREPKRLADVEARERELSEGHARAVDREMSTETGHRRTTCRRSTLALPRQSPMRASGLAQ